MDAMVLSLADAVSQDLGYLESNDNAAIGGMIARLASLDVPGSPKTTYNVGRIGGGIAFDGMAWTGLSLS